jgi:hypothetical protein
VDSGEIEADPTLGTFEKTKTSKMRRCLLEILGVEEVEGRKIRRQKVKIRYQEMG